MRGEPRLSVQNDAVEPIPEIDGGFRWFVDRASVLIQGALLCFFIVACVLLGTVKMNVTVEGGGTLQPLELHSVRPRISGVIDTIYVRTGSTVSLGQPLFKLDSLLALEELATLRRKFDELQSDVRFRRRNLPLDLLSAERRFRVSRANVPRAELRVFAAAADAGVSIESPLLDRSRRDSIPLAVSVARAELEGALAQKELDSIALVRLRSDTAELERARIASEGLLVSINRAENQLGRLVVVAPSAGRVLTDQLERLRGRAVVAGESILEIAANTGWQAEIFVPEAEVGRVKVGMTASLRLRADDGHLDRLIPGVVDAIASEPVSGTAAGSGPIQYRVLVRLTEQKLQSSLDVKRGFSIVGRIAVGRERIGVLLWERFVARTRGVTS